VATVDEKLYIQALGSVRVSLNHHATLPINAQKASALLVYLAFSGQQHSREALAELLWPDRSPERALASLRMALAALRQHLAPFLAVSRHSIGLATDSYVLDAHQLIAAVGEARRTSHRMPPTIARHLAATLDAYHDDFLRDFYGGSPEFEDWLALTREQLKRTFIEGALLLAHDHARAGRHADALPPLQHALKFDPLHEALNQQVMLCLFHSGQHRQAQAHFQDFRQRLAVQLEVEPSAETIQLFQLLRIDGDQDRPSANAPQPGLNNATYPTPLIGREGLLVEIAARLADPSCKLLTLVGPGGIGKTRLAQTASAMHQHTTSFPDGVFVVSLAAYSSAGQIAPAIASALGYRPVADGRPLEQQLADFMRHKQALIVLDNYEHLLDGASVATTLAAVPHVHVLVTSREPLQVPNEHVFQIAGLVYPQRGSPAPDYEAGRLFVRAVQRLFPDYAPSAADAAAIAQICAAVDGSPLGILLAAAWIDVLTPAEIAAEIQCSLQILENNLPSVPARQGSIRAVFEATWQRLGTDLRQVLMQLAVFRGGFTRDAAQRVTQANLRDLQALVGKALITRDLDGRMTMHELLRQYGEERLVETGHYDAARDAHSDYYLAFLQTREMDVKGARQHEALQEIDVDFENVRAAWSWAVQSGRLARLDDSVECLYWYCDMRHREPESYTLLQSALRIDDLDDGLRGHLLAYCWQEPAEGRRRLREALALAKSRRDPVAIARCLFQRGMIARMATHDAASRKLLECAYHAYAQLDDSFALGVVGAMRMTALIYSGRATEAETISTNLLPRIRASGDRIYLAALLYGRASSLATKGEDDEAEQCHQEARDILMESGDHLFAADIGAWGMGVALLRKGQFTLARQRAQALLSLAQEYRNSVSQARALCILSAVEMTESHVDSAYDLAHEACGLLGDHANATYADSFLAIAAATSGDFHSARTICCRWLTLAVSVGECVLTSMLLIPAAVVLAHEGKTERAITCAALALHYPANMGVWAERMLALHDLPAGLEQAVPATVYERAWRAGMTLHPQVILDELPEPGSPPAIIHAHPIANRASAANGSDRRAATTDTSRT